jgi:hypothetical protein
MQKAVLRFYFSRRLRFLFNSGTSICFSKQKEMQLSNLESRSGEKMAIIASFFKDETYGLLGPQMAATESLPGKGARRPRIDSARIAMKSAD